MSSSVAAHSDPSADGAASPDAAVRRSPFYLLSRDEWLSAWLHTSNSSSHVDHGVLICPPIGFEQLHTARSLRHLADAVARRGIPALRFDWHGTADSAGDDADPSRRATWQANVRDSAAWMRDRLGCRRVSVVGLRMGAALAVEALGPGDCDNLVLWAPVTSGKAYLRQMQAIEQLAERRPRPPQAAEGDVEAAGFLLSEETALQLLKFDLLQKELHCLQGLLVGPFDKRLAERFERFDIPCEQATPPGYAEMMAEPHFSRVPREAIQEIAAWLGKRIVTPVAGRLTIHPQKFGPSHVLLAGKAPEAEPAGCWNTVRERLLHFDQTRLFGVVSEPAASTDDLPAIVILNAGSASHVGPGRFNVELARYLAGLGFRSLRLDACGLGESVPDDATAENHPYPETVFHDVESAFGELAERYGATRFVLLGLCSGAYAAFQSAVQSADPRLVESVLINPLTFHWRAGMPFDASDAERVMQEHCRMARATNPRKLWKFLRGKTEIGYLDALRLLRKRMGRYLRRLRLGNEPIDAPAPTGRPSHPTEENLPADLDAVVAADRRLAMFLAENDPGRAVMTYHAGRRVKQLLRAGRLRISTIGAADHTFSRRAPRRELFEAVGEHLRRCYLRTS